MNNLSSDKTFLLGVGCQKGGTTWLHAYLNAFPETNFGFFKEYHVFDALYSNLCDVFYDDKIKELERIIASGDLKKEGVHLLKHIDFYRDTNNYFDYFDNLYNSNYHTRVVGDITPSYSGLPINAFNQIKLDAESRGFTVKVIFLVRDPVERIWSQLRMGRREATKSNPNYINPLSEKEELLSFYTHEQCEFRTKYDLTIRNLESAFPESHIHYEFYENLFNDNSIKKITQFLNLPFLKPNFSFEVNTTIKENNLPDDVIESVVNHYSDTYHYCAEKFGYDKIEQLWPSYKFLS